MSGAIPRGHPIAPRQGGSIHPSLPPSAVLWLGMPMASATSAIILPMATHSVLVVDDSRDAADTLAFALELLGCEVVRAYDGAAALQVLQRLRPTLIVLDLSMPLMDGYTLGRLIREDPALAVVPMVALSGFGRDADRRRSAEAGFDQHLLKPIEFEQLQQLLLRFPPPASP
jgi:CheY-like chemotaxis protein